MSGINRGSSVTNTKMQFIGIQLETGFSFEMLVKMCQILLFMRFHMPFFWASFWQCFHHEMVKRFFYFDSKLSNSVFYAHANTFFDVFLSIYFVDRLN